MAEPVYKKITELDVLATAIDGSETLPIVKAGKTYRRTLANLFGTGWIASLLGAFSAFKAPDADHADDADTVGGETPAQLHAASGLTGAIHLDRIPAELTGKNAATATVSASCSGNAATASSAAKLTTARTIGGVSFDGSANINLPGVNTTGNQNTTGTATFAEVLKSTGIVHSNILPGAGYYIYIAFDASNNVLRFGHVSGGIPIMSPTGITDIFYVSVP